MVNSSPQHKPQAARRAAATALLALGAVLGAVAALSVLWPALQRDDLALALETACQHAGPGDLVLLHHPLTSPAPPGCALLPWPPDQGATAGLGWFHRVLQVSLDAPPPDLGLDHFERRALGRAHLWLGRAPQQASLLAPHDPSSWTLSLERQQELWPCQAHPDQSWRCARAGGHKAAWIDTPQRCLRLAPWTHGAVHLQSQPPHGSHGLLLQWTSQRSARLLLEPGPHSLTLEPGQHQRLLPAPAQPSPWILRLPAHTQAQPCLRLLWQGPYTRPDPVQWATRVQRGRKLLTQGARPEEILQTYAAPAPREEGKNLDTPAHH